VCVIRTSNCSDPASRQHDCCCCSHCCPCYCCCACAPPYRMPRVTAGSQPFHSASTPSWRTRVAAVCTCRTHSTSAEPPSTCVTAVLSAARLCSLHQHSILFWWDERQNGSMLAGHACLAAAKCCCKLTMPGVGPSAFVAGCSCSRVLTTSASLQSMQMCSMETGTAASALEAGHEAGAEA
jgi:hypothetical protein